MIPKSLLFLCFLPSLLFSQQRSSSELLFRDTKIEIGTMNADQDLLYQFTGDSLTVVSMEKLMVKNTRKIHKTSDVPFVSLRPVWLKKQLLLSEKNGGNLYAITSDSLQRIDQSDVHNWQSFSSLFAKNDTLYKYGGYGYWTASNALSYYDKTSKGWEVIPFQEGDMPMGTHSQKHQLVSDQLYVFGGYYIRGQNRLKTILSNAIWALNFKTKKWTYVGEINVPNLDRYKKIQSSNPDDFELFNSQSGLIKVNIEENTVSVFAKNPLYFNVDIQSHQPVYKHKGHYYYYDIDNLDIRLKKVSEAAFVLQQTAEIPLYTNKASVTQQWLIAVFTFLSVVFLIGFFRKKKVKKSTLYVQSSKMVFNQKESEITPIEFELMTLLKGGAHIESAQILSMVYNESLTKSHNEKIKTQTIDGLNLKLSYLLGAQGQYISSVKSQEDKRIRVYHILLGEIMIKIVA